MSSIRRPLSCLLCSLLLLVLLCPSAGAVVKSSNPSSKKVDIDAFLDAFDTRYEIFANALSSDDYTGHHKYRKQYMTLTLDTSMRITQIEMPLILPDAIYDDEEFMGLSCITAFTILECSDPKSSKSTLFTCIADSFGNLIDTLESHADELTGSSDQILVYHGNYDYYAKLSDACSANAATDDYCIHLIASAR